jgi:thioredoxin-related protein
MQPGHLMLTVLLLAVYSWPAILAEETTETRDPREFFFAQTFGDLPEELAEAKKTGKIGLFLFRMMQTVLNQRQVQDWFAERFVSIAIDIRGDVELKDVDGITLPSKVFARHRKVELTPVMSFLDLNGVEIFRKSGMVANPEVFLLMGSYVSEKRYTDTVFTDYLAEKGRESAGEVLLTPAKND